MNRLFYNSKLKKFICSVLLVVMMFEVMMPSLVWAATTYWTSAIRAYDKDVRDGIDFSKGDTILYGGLYSEWIVALYNASGKDNKISYGDFEADNEAEWPVPPYRFWKK